MIYIYNKNTFLLILLLLSFTLGVSAQEENTTVIVEPATDSLQITSSAISSITGDVLNSYYLGSTSNALNGKVSGLFITEGSGEPGNMIGSISVRGYGTYNNLSVTVFVDGFESTIDYLETIPPAQIESIKVLKDAGALAGFGLRGANGVLWVTTKRGSLGKTKIDFHAKSGVQRITSIYKPLNAFEAAPYLNEAASNDNGMVWSPVYDAEAISGFQNGDRPNVDWYDQVLRENGFYTQGDLSFTGGNENAKYIASFGYVNQKGLYNVETNDETSNAEFRRYNTRINLDFNAFNFLEGQIDVGGTFDNRQSPNIWEGNLWSNLANYPSWIYGTKNSTGTWTGTAAFPNNPKASINATGYTSSNDRTMQGRLYLKENLDILTKGLYLEQAVNYNFWARGNYSRTRNYARYIDDVIQTTDTDESYEINDDNGQLRHARRQFQGGIGYERKFDKHEVKASVKYLLQSITLDRDINGGAGVHSDYNYENINGVFNYLYDNKYMAQLAFAYSGSDNFEEGNRFTLFPTLSLGWNASEETFVKNSKAINSLSMRASVGQTGFDESNFGRYLYMQYYNGIGSWSTGVASLNTRFGRAEGRAPSLGIGPEKSLKYNIGFDAELFNNHLEISWDAFMDKRSGILTQDNTYSAIYGITAPYLNVGKVTTRGIEQTLTFREEIGSFNFEITGMATFSNNVIDYNAEIPLFEFASAEGNPIFTPFGLEADGFYDINEFNGDGSLISGLPTPTFGAVQPGDVKYKDVNGDSFINEEDLVKIGDSYLPTATYALNFNVAFKGLDLGVLLQGSAGHDISLLYVDGVAVPFADNGNAYSLIEDRWAYYPDQNIDTRATASFPRLSTNTNLNNYQNSTLWMKNADYLKVRNIQLGYTFPSSFVKKMALSNARVYLNAKNLFSFSSLEDKYGIDPENTAGYPALKSLTLGLNVNL